MRIAALPRRFYSAVMGAFCAVAAPGALAQAPASPEKGAGNPGQAYPVRPIRIIAAQTAGGATDIFARMIGQKLSEAWKQPVVVENRPGAAGTIGTELTVRAPADGYTLLLATAGQIDVTFATVAATLPRVKANRLRTLAVTTPRRSQIEPHIPTVAEAGVPGYEVTTWYGMFGPAALPQEIVSKLGAEITRILGLAEIRERLFNDRAETANLPPAQFGAFIHADAARWAKLIKAVGITAD